MTVTSSVWFCRGVPDHLVAELGDIVAVGPDVDDRAEATVAFAGSEPYPAAVLDSHENLRLIARVGIGVDAIDLDAATERGILVTNTPDGPTTSTAEHAVALMMSVAHELPASAGRLRRAEGDYISRQDGMELSGRTLGVVGYGRIGRVVAGIAEAMGMTVIVSDPLYDGSVAVTELLEQADVVTLHVPATPENIGMIDAEALATMKPGSILVNCARGAIVVTDDLVAALERGHLRGAGLDVTEPEPLDPSHPLLHMENVIVTPHVASSTRAGRERMERMAFEQVRQTLAGARPSNLVNPLAWKG